MNGAELPGAARPDAARPDVARPNAARIYDYLLGGTHNFPADRQAGERLKELSPFAARAPFLQRGCLKELAVELTERRGYDLVVDFGSGLPTQGHLHETVRPGTTVIYSDIDPLVVSYGREIVNGTPHTFFFPGDARRPDLLMNHPEIQSILRGRRNAAFILWGVSAFLADEDIRNLARFLDQWSGPQSTWAFNAQLADHGLPEPVVSTAVELYRKLGAPLFLRSRADYEALVQPWRALPPGFFTLLQQHGMDPETLSPEDRAAYGSTGGGYGAYLAR